MKRTLLLLVCSTMLSAAFSQQKAVTETGDEVLLYTDGTWQYLNEPASEAKEIPTNTKKYTKSKHSSFLLKSKKLDVGVWLDPKKWSFEKAEDNPEAEYELQLKDQDLYGMLISEQVEIPLETLRGIAVENGKAAAPDLSIVEEEYRNVNGLKVLWLQMNGTMHGIKFSYYGYYYSNESGTVQFITYTSQNLLKGYKDDCEELLNGFVQLKK